MSLTNLKQVIGRNTSVIEIISDYAEPQLNRIKMDFGDKELKILMLTELAKIYNQLGFNISDESLKFLANYIYENYWFLKISDFNIIKNMIAETKIYGEFKVTDFIQVLIAYNSQRSDTAFMFNQSKDKQAIEDKELHFAKFTPMAERIALQKKRDIENAKANNEKIEQLQKLYPKNND